MRKILLLTVLLSLGLVGSLSARNLITYRPFDWQVAETEHYFLYYPKEMESYRDELLYQIDQTYRMFEEEIFVNFDSPDGKIKSWHPKGKLNILAYPGEHGFRQQRIVWTIMPPGVLGFMLPSDYRTVVPYLGYYDQYRETLVHEMAHTWFYILLMQFVRKEKQTPGIVPVVGDLETMKRISCPLWAIEGWAQLISRDFGQGENQTLLSCYDEDYIRQRVCHGYIPRLTDQMGGYDVYAFGYKALRWNKEKYGISKLVEFIAFRPSELSFERAWEAVFGEKLAEMERKWRRDMRREYYPNYSADPIFELEKVKKAPKTLGMANYDHGLYLGYFEDAKWGLKIEIWDLQALLGQDSVQTMDCWRLHRQFQSKSLWYKYWIPPAIKNGLAAIVITREGQDEIQIFQLKRVKRGVPFFKKVKRVWRKVQTFRHKQVLGIEYPCFDKQGQRIVFQGTDRKGFSDLYIYHLKTKTLVRLSNDIYTQTQPVFGDDNLLFYLTDFSHPGKISLYSLDLHSGKKQELYMPKDSSSYLDQILVVDQWVFFQEVTLGHSPRLFLWNRQEGKVYQILSNFEGIRQLLDWQNKKSLLFLSREGEFCQMPLSIDSLKELPSFQIEPKEIESEGWQPPTTSAPFYLYKQENMWKLWRAGKVVKIGGGGYYAYFSDITGEEIFLLAGVGTIGYYPSVGWFSDLLFLFHYWNLRKRLQTSYGIEYWGGWFVQFADRSIPLGYLGTSRFYADFYWPFNLEDGISFGGLLGYVEGVYYPPTYVDAYSRVTGDYRRANLLGKKKIEDNFVYPFRQGYLANAYLKRAKGVEAEDEGLRKNCPFLGPRVAFIHEAVFGNLYGEIQRGSYLAAQASVYAGTQRLLEGNYWIDARHYLQVGTTRALLASRVLYANSFGTERQMYRDPDQRKRKWWEILYSWPYYDALGMIQVTEEFRFPVFNWFAFQPGWEDPEKGSAFAFRVNGCFFYEGGDVWDKKEEIKWLHRAGVGLKIVLLGDLSLRIDWYKQGYNWQEWLDSEIKPALYFNFDF